MKTLTAFALLLSLAASSFGQSSKPHPRLMLDGAPVSNAVSNAGLDPLEKRLQARLVQEADWMMTQPVENYSIVSGSLLTTSRDVLSHVLTLSLAYRQTGEFRYFDRARTQLLAAADFQDWYPSHFLGTSEMTLAMAIGYDWLFDSLSDSDKTIIRKAIVEKGLNQGLLQYKQRADWTTKGYNWSQVCGASMAIAAVAIRDEEPSLSARVLTLTIPTVKRAVADYKPEGIPSEGPVYWRYGMAFHTMLNRVMVSNFGTKQSVMTDAAFAKTAWYPVYVLGTSGKNFNFADSSDWFVPTPATLELARSTKQPAIAGWTRQQIDALLDTNQHWIEEHRLSALFLAWNSMNDSGDVNQMPLDRKFDGKQDIVTMRGSWTDKNASFVGIKGGQNGVPHGQLDLGSFVFDANGERWATDLGKDSYNLPGYFGKERYTYYRNSTLSHNTVCFGANQTVNGSATMKVGLGVASPWAQLNLTRAYSGAARSVVRGFQLVNRKDLVITDQVIQAKSAWRWQMVTGATITLNGSQALLELNGKQLLAEIAAPSGAQFSVVSTNPNDSRQNQNYGTQMLVVNMPSGSAQLQVRLSPLN